MRALPWLLLAAVAAAVAPARARGEGLEKARTADARQTARDLGDLARWCQEKRLYGKRDEVLEHLLRFDPEDEDARRRLRYHKAEDGMWVQDGKYHRPHNLARGADEADAKLAKVLAAHRARMLAACRQASTIPELMAARREAEGLDRQHPGDADVAATLREVMLRTHAALREKGLVPEMEQAGAWLVQHHPQDLAVRAALGQSQHGGAWVLDETARALDHGGAFETVVAAARKAVTVGPGKLPAAAQRIDLPWQPGVATKHVRVLGTADAKHLGELAITCEAAGTLFERAYGRAPVRRGGLTLFVFAGKGEVDKFLKGYPVVDNPTLALRDKLDLVYADGSTLVLDPNPPDAWKDLAGNEILNQMLADTYLHSEAPRGWHAEGLSRYLAWKLTGTRLSINVSGKYAGQAGSREVPGSKDHWLVAARAALAKDPRADLQLTLGKGTDVFTPRDALIAYAFAVYLFEGFDGVAGAFVKALAASKDVDKVCRSILAMPRTVAEARLRHWLDEVIRLRAPK